MICPACTAKRLHTSEDWQHHPLAGHGFAPETGWTKQAAKIAHDVDEAAKKKAAGQ